MKFKLISISLFLYFTLITGFVIFRISSANKRSNAILSAYVQIPTPTASITVNPTYAVSTTPVPEKNLGDLIAEKLKGSQGNFAIVIKHLKTGESFTLNEHQEFETGSLYKLWVMATVYDYIQKGKLKGSDVLSEDVATLNSDFDISSEVAEQNEGKVTFTVNEALDQMITISHNYAALLLSKRVRLSNVAGFLEENGFNESKLGLTGGPPVTTAFDMGLFMEKLYKGNLINDAHKDDMIDLLKKQKLNNKIPKLLPDRTEIAHKTGEIGTYSHDAGIIYTGVDGDYILVIMSESDRPDIAEGKISEISKAVYDHFKSPHKFSAI